MAYRLVISPTASRQLAEIITRHPYPALLKILGERLEALAADPVRSGLPRSRSHGRPWIMLKYETPEINLYFQVFYRFVDDEERLEILSIDSLAL
jgi:hypothetical protein